MRAPGYGEDQPRLDDDRLPVVLVVLDGLGDRPVAELDGHTPAEAAATPNLDALTVAGASGWHIPFGWGVAPASELAHWAMFGFADVPFPGRSVLEATGAGIDLPDDIAVTFAALRTSTLTDGRLWITGRTTLDDTADVNALMAELMTTMDDFGVTLHPVGHGEAVLVLDGYTHPNVTDSDPFFEDFHPWLRVQPAEPTAAALADHLNRLLAATRAVLLDSGTNRQRRHRGLPALNVLTTKWTGHRSAGLPSFTEQNGVAGAAVTSTRLYRGIATLLGMSQQHQPQSDDLTADIAERLGCAEQLIADGARFVHVHTKVTDEAGHTKQPYAKRDVLEALDAGMTGLSELARHAIVAVTGDHATPSTNGVLHTADPTPLLLAGPVVRPDRVTHFGEQYMRDGWFGVVHARELMPLLFSHANRPVFLGHRATPRRTAALPDHPEPMPLDLNSAP